jgi:predicted anti-sigma-YlaC factor YlaD
VSTGCEQWRGTIAVDALGSLDPSERAGLLAHLDGCPACRALAHELGETASVLAFADGDALGPTASVPPALTERVLGTLHDDARTARHRRRTRVGAALAGVGALAAALALLAVLGGPAAPRPDQRHEVLTGTGGATATAVLADEPYGTSIAFTEDGLAAGHAFQVSARATSGAWWTTGSITAAGHAVTAHMTCYMGLTQITGIRVTDAHGRVVLESVARPGTSW